MEYSFHLLYGKGIYPSDRQLALNFERQTARVIVKVSGFGDEIKDLNPTFSAVEVYSKLKVPAGDDDTFSAIQTYKKEECGNNVFYAFVSPGASNDAEKFIKLTVTYNNGDGNATQTKINVIFKNEKIKSDLVFTKTDISTDVGLPNTLIEIYDANTDELVFSGRTDENGYIIIKNIEYGDYYILEKEAPEGYELNPERMYFSVTEDGEIIKVNMKDSKIVEVPDTSTTDYHVIEILGSLAVITGVGVIIYVCSKRKK